MAVKSILITGAAGFIGSHLAEKLAQEGHFVIGYDNFNSYYSPPLKRARAKRLHQLGIDTVEGDITSLESLTALFDQYPMTHLVHLAAQAGVRYSLTEPQAYISSNLAGFVNILEICRQRPHLKLVYASSSSVYGLNKKVPFSEKDPVDLQASLYGVTKRSNELMAAAYHHLYGISVTGLRFFTVYGPWGRPDMAYYRFAEAILNDEPIAVYNHGQMERGFTYIDDIIQGCRAAIALEAPHEIFNLGNHRPVSLLYFIEILEKALGKKADKHFLPMQPGDVPATYADIAHAQNRLGFDPCTPIEAGLPKFVEWLLEFRFSKKYL